MVATGPAAVPYCAARYSSTAAPVLHAAPPCVTVPEIEAGATRTGLRSRFCDAASTTIVEVGRVPARENVTV